MDKKFREGEMVFGNREEVGKAHPKIRDVLGKDNPVKIVENLGNGRVKISYTGTMVVPEKYLRQIKER